MELRFSIRSLLFAFAAIALLLTVGSVIIESYRQSQFQREISAAWEEAPVVSKPMGTTDQNDIEILFNDDGVWLSNTESASLDKRLSGSEQNYDLKCDAGHFLLIFYNDIYSDLAKSISSSDSSYQVIIDALSLDNHTHWSSAPLWTFRMMFMPIGCNARLQHYETKTKKGIVSGILKEHPETILYVFDSSGEYAISVQALDAKISTWDDLIKRVVLTKKSNIRD